MDRQPRSRLFYRESPREVVVHHDGREIARYRSAEELVEVHIKGMMASDERAAKQIQKIYRGETDCD